MTEVDGKTELLAQTKRHSAIVKLLGLQHVIVAINKMDLIDYSEARFDAIRLAYLDLAQRLGLQDVRFVPVSALKGDNIVYASEKMPWYQDEPLLDVLEALPVAETSGELRFPVQLVARQDGAQADDFRGYMGRVESGSLRVGQTLRVLPSNRTATVAEIIGPRGDLAEAFAGQCVTVRLTEDVDVSRGDTFVSADATLEPSKKIGADVCWFDEEALAPQRKYLLKQATSTVYVKIGSVDTVLDVSTLLHGTDKTTLSMNDIGRVQLSLQKPLAADLYDTNPATGAFVLIDEATHHTVAAGMIRTLAA